MASTLIGQRRLVVKELYGDERELILTGAAMPSAPTDFGGASLLLTKTTYPGNPVASSQVHGTEEGEDTWTGRWRDQHFTTVGKCLWDAFPIVRASELVEIVESLLRRAGLVKVTWADVSRVGFLREFKPSWRLREIVNWTMTWDWVSAIERADPPFIAAMENVEANRLNIDAAKELVRKVVNAALKTFEKANEYLSDTIRELENATLAAAVVASLAVEAVAVAREQLEAAARAAYTAQRAAYNLAYQLRTVSMVDDATYMGWMSGWGSRHYLPPAGPPDDAGAASRGGMFAGSFSPGIQPGGAYGAMGIADRSFLPMASGSNRLGSVPRGWHLPEYSGMTYRALPPVDLATYYPYTHTAEWLATEQGKQEMVEDLLDAANRYAAAAAAIERIMKPDVKYIHYTMVNEDLRSISIQYFGTQDGWGRIARDNSITGSLCAPGTKLTVYA